MTDAIDDTLTLIDWVTDRLPDLWDSRLRGTQRPWRQPDDDIPPEVLAEREMLARLERIEADGRMPGYSRAPLHVDVLDTWASILMSADLLHEHIAQTVGHPTLDDPTSAYDDPCRFLAYVRELLREACDTDPDMFAAARDRLEEMRDAISTALGEVVDGQRLDAICPFCCGVTTRHPAGGARTMRFRFRDISTEEQPDLVDPVIVCENPTACVPFAAECGLWIKGKPAWRWPEWEWLAGRLLPRQMSA